ALSPAVLSDSPTFPQNRASLRECDSDRGHLLEPAGPALREGALPHRSACEPKGIRCTQAIGLARAAAPLRAREPRVHGSLSHAPSHAAHAPRLRPLSL